MRVLFVAALSIALIGSGSIARAQVSIDFAKLSCEQMLRLYPDDGILFAAWLSGYFNGQKNNTVVDIETFRNRLRSVLDFCASNPSEGIMNVIAKRL